MLTSLEKSRKIISMIRVVLGSEVVFAGVRSAIGASRQLLLAALDGRLILLLSTALMLEYEMVLTRPKSLTEFGVPAEHLLAMLDDLARNAVPVSFDFRWRPLASDADDDLVLETAINGGADVIASFNLADLADGAARFGIMAAKPATILRRLTS